MSSVALKRVQRAHDVDRRAHRDRRRSSASCRRCSHRLATDEARDFLAGRITEDDFLEAYTPAVAARIRPRRRDDRDHRADDDLDVPPGLEPPGTAARRDVGTGLGDRRLVPAAVASCTSSPTSCSASCGRRPTRPSRPAISSGRRIRSASSSPFGGCCTAWHRSRSPSPRAGSASAPTRSTATYESLAEAVDERFAISFVASLVGGRRGGRLHRDGPPTLRPPPSVDGRIGAAGLRPRTLTIYFVRHAKAGDRSSWSGPDAERPLSKAGLAAGAQARQAARRGRRDDTGVEPVRALRPDARAARRTGRAADRDRRAAHRGRRVRGCARTARRRSPEGAVLCSHGDVIPETIDALVRRGLDVRTPADWRKASVWVLQAQQARSVHASRGVGSAWRVSSRLVSVCRRASASIWARRPSTWSRTSAGGPPARHLLDVRQARPRPRRGSGTRRSRGSRTDRGTRDRARSPATAA